MKQRIITLFCICLLLFLLVHPEEALLSAKDGMSLWLNVMIPTLLPFLILTGILLKTGNSFLNHWPLSGNTFSVFLLLEHMS